MKTNREELMKCLDRMIPVMKDDPNQVGLLKLEAEGPILRITTGSPRTTATTELGCTGEEISFSANAKFLRKLLGELDGPEVEIKRSKENRASVKALGRRRFALPVLDAAEFNYFDPPEFEGREVDAEELVGSLKAVAHAICPAAPGREFLQVVRLQSKSPDGYPVAVATSGYLMAACRTVPLDLTIPEAVVSFLVKAAGDNKTIKLGHEGEKALLVQIGNYRLRSLLPGGNFPPWEVIFDEKWGRSVSVSRDALKSAAHATTLVHSEACVILERQQNEIRVFSQSSEKIDAEANDAVDVLEGEGEINCMMEPERLVNTLSAADGEVQLCQTMDNSALQVRSEGYMGIVMTRRRG